MIADKLHLEIVWFVDDIMQDEDIMGDVVAKMTVKSQKLNQWYQSSQAVACIMNTGCFAYVEEKV